MCFRKCHFARSQLPYLGHVIDAAGNAPETSYLTRLQEQPVPNNKRQLRKFLGICGWIRDYIPRFADIAAPLTDLLGEKQRWHWTTVEQQAFEKIKAEFRRPLKLSRPDFKRGFVLQTDASGIGVAAVLLQEYDNRRHIIAYASARLNRTERRYHVNEQECLAVIWAVKKYRTYLEDRRFILRTDSKALTWLTTMKDAGGKLARWSLLLQEFVFDVEHCPGRLNDLPDALSRLPADEPVPADTVEADRLLPPVLMPSRRDVFALPATVSCVQHQALMDEVREAQRQDPDFARINAQIARIREVGPEEPGEVGLMKFYETKDGLIYRSLKGHRLLVVPIAMQPRVMHFYHDHSLAGHPGAEETARALQIHYYWPFVDRDVRRYVRQCYICAVSKRGPRQPNAPLRPRQPERPWETVAVDVMGPYPSTRNGNRFIIVATDLFSRWVEATATQNTPSPIVVKFLDEIFARYGYPEHVLTDNGTQFNSIAWNQALQRWGSAHWTTPIYHPRANPTERRNQEIKKALRAHVHTGNPKLWDSYLHLVLYSLRTRRNKATNYTPSELLLGYNLPRPGVATKDADESPEIRCQRLRNRRAQARANQRRYQDVRFPVDRQKPVNFQVGEEVLIRSTPVVGRPFAAKWRGPYHILAVAGPTVYWIDVDGNPIKQHVDRIRRMIY